MSEYLFKISVVASNQWQKKMKPVYAVSTDKESAKKYVEIHLRFPYHAGKVTQLGKALGSKMFSGN